MEQLVNHVHPMQHATEQPLHVTKASKKVVIHVLSHVQQMALQHVVHVILPLHTLMVRHVKLVSLTQTVAVEWHAKMVHVRLQMQNVAQTNGMVTK